MTRSLKGLRRLAPRAVPPVASILVFWAAIGGAQAQDLCPDIKHLIDQARSQFVEIAVKSKDGADGRDAIVTLAGASYCQVTKRSRRSAYHCGWEFPFRAQEAYDTFDEFARQANDCVGRHAILHSDRSVNHPDYYASRRYEMEQADLTVSVKDKSALGRTLVFIRIQDKSAK